MRVYRSILLVFFFIFLVCHYGIAQSKYLILPQPENNNNFPKIRLVKSFSFGDEVYFLYRYDMTGRLFEISEYLRSNNVQRSIYKDVAELAFKKKQSLIIDYDSIARPSNLHNYIYDSSVSGLLTSPSTLKDPNQKMYFKYDEKNRIIESGSSRNDIIDRHEYDENNRITKITQLNETTGVVTRYYDYKYIGNQIIFEHKMPIANSNNDRTIQKLEIVYDDSFYPFDKLYGNNNFSNTLVGIYGVRGIPYNIISITPLSSNGTKEINNQTTFKYTFDENGIPTKIDVKHKQETKYFELFYELGDGTEYDYLNYFISAKEQPGFNPERKKIENSKSLMSYYTYDSEVKIEELIGDWENDGTFPTELHIWQIQIGKTNSGILYAKPKKFEQNVDFPGSTPSLDSELKGVFKSRHTIRHNDYNRSLEMNFCLLENGKLRVHVKEIFVNPKENVEYVLFLDRKR